MFKSVAVCCWGEGMYSFVVSTAVCHGGKGMMRRACSSLFTSSTWLAFSFLFLLCLGLSVWTEQTILWVGLLRVTHMWNVLTETAKGMWHECYMCFLIQWSWQIKYHTNSVLQKEKNIIYMTIQAQILSITQKNLRGRF